MECFSCPGILPFLPYGNFHKPVRRCWHASVSGRLISVVPLKTYWQIVPEFETPIEKSGNMYDAAL